MLNKLVVDIAHYTEGVDPLPLHEASIQMMILKVDDRFVKNGKIFSNAGMPVAAYHWIDPTRDAAQQVDRTLEIVRTSAFQVLAVFADFEQWWSKWNQWNRAIRGLLGWHLVGRFMGSRLSDHAKGVFERFQASEFPTFGYTSASFVNEFALQATGWMSQYQWWLAHYITCDKQTLTWADLKAQILPMVDFLPAMPPGLNREQVIGHQFTGDKLSLPGLHGDKYRTKYSAADVNLFDEQFLEDIGAVPDPKPLPDALHEAIVTASPTLHVRSGPGLSHPILYKLMKGAPVKITKIEGGWARLRSYEEEWVSEDYLRLDAEVTEPVEEPHIPQALEVDLPGVTYHAMRRYDSDCHILIIDPANKRFHVTPYTGLKTVSAMARKSKADVVVNGDGWGSAGFPNSIAASDGKVDQNKQFDGRPWINISRDNRISFNSNWRKWKKKVYNAVSGDRYVINNWKYNQKITDTRIHPRTAVGVTQGNKLILIVADGRTSKSRGLSLRELGYIFEEFSTKTAINLDGGGSSALWIKDRIVNVPIEDIDNPGIERAVANHLCIFIG